MEPIVHHSLSLAEKDENVKGHAPPVAKPTKAHKKAVSAHATHDMAIGGPSHLSLSQAKAQTKLSMSTKPSKPQTEHEKAAKADADKTTVSVDHHDEAATVASGKKDVAKTPHLASQQKKQATE